MKPIYVVKFGGSVFSDAEGLKRASRFVAEIAKERQVVVVVSALGGETDRLLRVLNSAGASNDPSLRDSVLSMGERTSARLFCSSLAANGLKPELVDVDTPYWPIVTNSKHLDAEPILEETCAKVNERLKPLLDSGSVPVVCGFIGVSVDGRVTTLGRGGSDTTATLLGRCLGAKEVVLIKNVDGVLSSGSKDVQTVRKLTHLTVEELKAMTQTGAKIVADKALKFVQGYTLRVTSISEGLNGGTTVVPSDIASSSKCTLLSEDVSLVALVAPEETSVYPALVKKVSSKGGSVLVVSMNTASASFYVSGSVDEPSIHELVEEGLAKAVSVRTGLCCISVAGMGFSEKPGTILAIMEPLRAESINVYGLTTIGDSAKIFVSVEQAKKAIELIDESLSQLEALQNG
ncbi:MAG: hypothetical protein QW767_03690 [Thermoprotei archaeon]